MGIRIGIIALVLVVGHGAYGVPSYMNENAHVSFLEAETALESKRYNQFDQMIGQLDHPLKPYLEAKRLRTRFNQNPKFELDSFFAAYPSAPFTDTLRAQWLYYLAKREKWTTFLEYYPEHYQGSGLLSLQCHHVNALHQTQKQFAAINEGQRLWLLGISLPKACDPVFALWESKGYLSQDLIWQRFLNAQASGQSSLARYLQKKLPSQLKSQSKQFRKLWYKPRQIALSTDAHLLPPHARFLLAQRMISRTDNSLPAHHPLLANLSNENLRQLTLLTIEQAAKHSRGDVFYWYEMAKRLDALSPELEEHFLSGAIKQGNWPIYHHVFKLASSAIQQDSRWQYWQGRTLQMMGAQITSSLPHFEAAAKHRDFYGFMASQTLGIKASMNHRSVESSAADLQRTRLLPSVKRATALLELRRIPQARREWQHAFSELSDNGRHALALLAGRLNWSDRAIMTLAQLQNWHDLQLRFPLAHLEQFREASSTHQINKHWAYGIARQESAFMYDARSPVGATGLMQLMPATARGVSRHLRLQYSSHKLLNPDYNIQLGTGYLRQLLTRFDGNRVLATAAYNAGPGNVNRWLKRNQGPIDLWIERIPYSETQEYVKRVLTYSVIYSYRLGRQEPILDYDTLASWGESQPELQISLLESQQNGQG
ncbi:transglycosylase SLT domain-containing protein [Bermanella sp. R86510]|uniref:transglycosylase SLT domain-containing protein n=1 Tax=unclassified Bermanella TaxID=2627862 RepID=UPI0037C978CF